MQNNRSGKALVSAIIVLFWLGLIGGGVYWYVKNEEAKAQKILDDIEAANAGREKLAFGPPPLKVPDDHVEIVRTEPFKLIFSDDAPTRSSEGKPDLNPEFSETALSDEEFDSAMTAYMLEGVKDHSESEDLGKLLEKIVAAAGNPEDLKPMLESVKPYVEGELVSSDPLVQHLAGLVYLANDKKANAQSLLLGAIRDYPKFEYPSRFAVLAMTQRANTKPAPVPTYTGHERQADAIAHWMQNDFTEIDNEQRFCWAILKDAIASMGQSGHIEAVKKIVDKNQEEKFISPWLAEMISAHYYIQMGKAEFASDEVIANAKKHLNAAIAINSKFPEPTADLKIVEKMANPGGSK
ncbi:MAG: hypothetical protein AB8B55_09470 [Mariniblastus sp.]